MFSGVLKYNRLLPLLKLNRSFIKRGYCQCLPEEPCDPATKVSLLTNGVRIATEWLPTNLSCMALYAEAGPRFEFAHNNGISHFIEHMAFKGFVKMNQAHLENNLSLMGAKATAHTSREIQSFCITFLSEHAVDVAQMLTAIICQLNMNGTTIENEKCKMCLEMVDEDNDPRAVTFDYLHQTAFQGTPLSQRVIGPSRNIQKFDMNMATSFMQEHYQPYKLCLASAGCVDHEAVVGCAQATLGGMVGQAACQSDDGPCRFTGSQIIYRDDSMPFAHVAIAFEAPGCTSTDYIKLLVASNLMGKWHKSQCLGEGNASPLAQAAAVDGICESFESFYIAYRDIGLWGVYFVAKRMNLEDMVEMIQNQWMHLCTTTQRSDVERAVNLTRLDLARSLHGVVNNCHDIGHQLMYTCTRKSFEEKLQWLSTVDSDAIKNCADKMLYDRCPAVAAVGPTENLPDYTRIRAGQYWLRL